MRRAFSLIEILVVLGILALLGGALYVGTGAFGGKSSHRPDGKGETVVGRAMLRGKDSECHSNLGQVRTSIQIAMDPVENTFPATLKDCNLSDTFLTCPVGKEKYEYDGRSGNVHCPHPGHEGY